MGLLLSLAICGEVGAQIGGYRFCYGCKPALTAPTPTAPKEAPLADPDTLEQYLTAASVEAHYYTGITGTSKLARYTSATMRMDAFPTNCKYSWECFAISWTTLWEQQIGQYVEAGIGYQPNKCPAATPVKLWYATPAIPGARTVTCLPLGATVKVSITKNDGQEYATVVWDWTTNRISYRVSLPKWINGPGIHPTKIEVFTDDNLIPPKPVRMRVTDTYMYTGDAYVTLQQTAPYLLQPGSTLADFSVNY